MPSDEAANKRVAELARHASYLSVSRTIVISFIGAVCGGVENPKLPSLVESDHMSVPQERDGTDRTIVGARPGTSAIDMHEAATSEAERCRNTGGGVSAALLLVVTSIEAGITLAPH